MIELINSETLCPSVVLHLLLFRRSLHLYSGAFQDGAQIIGLENKFGKCNLLKKEKNFHMIFILLRES